MAGGYKFISTKPEVAVESLKLKTNRFLNSAGGTMPPGEIMFTANVLYSLKARDEG